MVILDSSWKTQQLLNVRRYLESKSLGGKKNKQNPTKPNPTPPETQKVPLIYRIVKQFGSEITFKDHLVQPPKISYYLKEMHSLFPRIYLHKQGALSTVCSHQDIQVPLWKLVVGRADLKEYSHQKGRNQPHATQPIAVELGILLQERKGITQGKKRWQPVENQTLLLPCLLVVLQTYF